MKLSTKCRYGLRALIEIGKRHSSLAVKRKDIALAQNISHGYLENILIALKNAGIINTSRGAHGGFILARSASTITILEIVNALEGSIAPVDCIEKPETCTRIHGCAAQQIWKKLHDTETKLLSSITLADAVEMDTHAVSSTYDI